MYEQVSVSGKLVLWAASVLQLKAASGRVGLDTPLKKWHSWTIVLPRPHTRLEEVAAAVREGAALQGHPVLLVMPVAAYGDNRWREFKSNCSWLKRIPATTPLSIVKFP